MAVALGTGANKGVGLAVARLLGQRRVDVWVGARDPERGRAAVESLSADGIAATFVQIDVTSTDSIAAAAARLEREVGRLDILVNNAGMIVEFADAYPRATPPSQVPIEALRVQHATNVLGAIAMIQAMLPLLRRSEAGRIVNVGARQGTFAHQSRQLTGQPALNLIGYSSTKAALNMVTLSFAIELRDTPIKINAVTPGIIATDISGTSAAQLAGQPGFGTPETAAETIVPYALLPADGPTGGFFGPLGAMPLVSGARP
jgi:NAD(P)-dependent dehydrogenase (short-subunit alcohol dehydrogenase family)